MEESTFPPSPNWFLSKIMTCRYDGSIAYGSRNNIVIFNCFITNAAPTVIISSAHELRVTAVCSPPLNCDEKFKSTIVSSSDDGSVKLWDPDSISSLMEHRSHTVPNELISKVVCVDWSCVNPQLVVSAAQNSSVVLWNVTTNTVNRFLFSSLLPTTLACSLHKEKLVGVGTKSGLVAVLDLSGKGQILHRLRGHDNEIQSLSWCPARHNVLKDNTQEEEALLVSGSRDKDIFIWKTGTDGRCEAVVQLPPNPLSKKEKDQNRTKTYGNSGFVAVCWASPHLIYCSTLYGELVFWNLGSFLTDKTGGDIIPKKPNKQLKNCWQLAHSHHERGLFAVCSERLTEKWMDVDSQKPPTSLRIWTTAQDRKIVTCRLNQDQLTTECIFHTLNGSAYCAAVSPHDPTRIAVAVGDGMIRLWNLMEPHRAVDIYWQRIKDKVMSLAWHPIREGLLVYGTSEGRVGLIDTHSNKPPNVFKPGHPRPVYNLLWGPPFNRDSFPSKELAVFSVGGHDISQYNPSKIDADPVVLGDYVQLPCCHQTDASWKPDYSLLAVGNEDGTISILEPPEFKIVANISAYKKLIQSLAWHPSSTVIESGVSPYHGYLTSASMDPENEIRVFNCLKGDEGFTVDTVARLRGHAAYVQSVSWSPHTGGHLVSTSADCTVLVWDIVSQTMLASFIPTVNQMPLFSIWSPMDPDLIITGCKNSLLCVWKISTRKGISPQLHVKPKRKKKHRQPGKAVVENLTNKTEDDQAEGVEVKTALAITVETRKKSKAEGEGKIFSRCWKGTNGEQLKICYGFLKQEPQGRIDKSFLVPFLQNESEWTNAVQSEDEHQRRMTNSTEKHHIDLWQGNLKEVIEEKMINGRLDEFLVALSPSVSPRLWQEACVSYSKTLAAGKQYRKAASYLVACHKIEDALQLLVDAHLYLEALCLAKSRLHPSDPKLNDIICAYGKWLSANGSFLQAFQCYLYVNDYFEAAKVTRRSCDPEVLSVAALAAKNGGFKDMEVHCANEALVRSIHANNWELARRISDDHADLQHLRLLFNIAFTLQQLDAGLVELEQDLLTHVRLLTNMEKDAAVYNHLKNLDQSPSNDEKVQMLVTVAHELALANCTLHSDEMITHILKALNVSSSYSSTSENTVYPLYRLCTWLAPSGFFIPESVFARNHSNDKVMIKLERIRAFLYEGLIEQLIISTDSVEAHQLLTSIELLKRHMFDEDSLNYFSARILILSSETKRAGFYNASQQKPCLGLPYGDTMKESGEKATYESRGIHQETHDGPSRELVSSTWNAVNERESAVTTNTRTINGLGDGIQEGQDMSHDDEALPGETSRKRGEEPLSYLLAELNRLKKSIKGFGEIQIAAPNPAISFRKLRNACEKYLAAEKTAETLLEEIESNWGSWNHNWVMIKYQ